VTLDLFRRACSQFATGVCIVTTFDKEPHGFTVNSFTSVSLRPPLVLFCIDHDAAIVEVFRRTHHFAINVLAEAQQELSTAFATKPERRFEGVTWTPGLHSLPILEGALATLECRLVRVFPAGDHDVLIGEAMRASVPSSDTEPLAFFRGRYVRLERKSKPTA
jgi:flavin reductase (DIM6/NTAB) family NADH-FMN oxidoreductase RutF